MVRAEQYDVLLAEREEIAKMTSSDGAESGNEDSCHGVEQWAIMQTEIGRLEIAARDSNGRSRAWGAPKG